MQTPSFIRDSIVIETERLILRELSPRIYQDVFQSNDKHQIKSFFGFETDDELLTEKIRFETGITSFNKSFFSFHMIEKASEKVIGSIGYHTWYTLHDRAEIYYIIRSETDRQKGYTSEAISPVLEYGFNKMSLNRVEAFLSAENKPSVRLMQKSGFKKEGTLKAHYFINGKYEDSDIYGLLKSEYILRG